MNEQCHVCGPVKHEAPTVICAPCALAPAEPVPYGNPGLMRVVAWHMFLERQAKRESEIWFGGLR